MRKENRKRNRIKKRVRLLAFIVILIILICVVISSIKKNKTKEVTVAEQDKLAEETENIEFTNSENIANTENVIEVEIGNQEVETTNTITSQTTKNTGETTYKLEVNCTQNVVNVYTKDENGEYTNCVKAMLCSVGPATPTSGTYSLKKYSGWEWKGLFGDVYGQYATQITGNILFHSVPYTEKYNKGSLEYWEYDKLGTSASMGCVRLTVQNAKWIYDNCASGTKVKFYQDSNPGPLGKPSEQKISSEGGYNNWDPTDPDSENPWRNYGKTVEEKQNTENNNETVTIPDKEEEVDTENSIDANVESNNENNIAENTEIKNEMNNQEVNNENLQ